VAIGAFKSYGGCLQNPVKTDPGRTAGDASAEGSFSTAVPDVAQRAGTESRGGFCPFYFSCT